MGRRLGQHFLADQGLLDRIVDALEPDPTDLVIEIGPGRGTLTRRLAPRVARVIAIEKDRRLATALSGTGDRGPEIGVRESGTGTTGPAHVAPANVRVVLADALEADWPDLLMGPPVSGPRSPDPGPRSFKVIGNIPYYITTPLIEKALTPPLPVLVVFLVQKEVADRLGAPPGSKTYGALSAGVQAIASVERLFVVKKGAFRPPPKVDSALVRLRPLPKPLVAGHERAAWRRFLARLFSQRRKQLGRSLRSLTGGPKETVEAMLGGLGIDPATRPELLAPQALVALFRAVAR